jgi:polyisoprenoid-binding protein YceI
MTFIAMSLTSIYAQTFNIDTETAVINFNYLSEETTGTITNVTASIKLNLLELATSKIEGTADVTTLSTGNLARDKHLKSKTYFNVVAFPTIKFTSSSIKQVGDHYEATGIVNMKGFSKPVTFIINIKDETLVLTTTIFADDFGLAIKKGKETSVVEIEVVLPVAK